MVKIIKPLYIKFRCVPVYPYRLMTQAAYKYRSFKAAGLQMLKKITVNSGQVMFSGEMYY